MAGEARAVISAEDRASAVFNAAAASANALGIAVGGLTATLAVVGASFAAGVKRIIGEADNINDLSKSLGIGVEKLAAYKLIAEQSGTSLEQVGRGIKSLSVAALSHGDAMRKAGIDTQDADKAMRQIADLFAVMPDGMEKSALAVKLFGREGLALIPMLNEGSKGLDESAKKSAAYSAQMAILAPNASELNGKMAELSISADALYANIANRMVPGMTNIATSMATAAHQSGVLKALWVGLVGVVDELSPKAETLAAAFYKARLFGANKSTSTALAEAEQELEARKSSFLNSDYAPEFMAPGKFQNNARIEYLNQAIVGLKDLRAEELAAAQAASYSNEGHRSTWASMKEGATTANAELSETEKRLQALKKILDGDGKSGTSELDKLLSGLDVKREAMDSGMSPESAKSLDILNKALDQGKLSWERYVGAMNTVIDRDTVMSAQQRKLTEEEKRASSERDREAKRLDGMKAKAKEVVDEFSRQAQQDEERINRQAEMTGMREREVEVMQAQMRLEDEAANARRTAFHALGKDPELYAAAIAAINKELEKQKPIITDATRRAYEYGISWDVGVRNAMNRYLDDAENMAAQSGRLATNVLQGMEDQLVSLATTGKADFKSMADSIIADLARIAAKKVVVGIVDAATGTTKSSSDSSGTATGAVGSVAGKAVTGSGTGTAALEAVGGWAGVGAIAVIVAAFFAAEHDMNATGGPKREGDTFLKYANGGASAGSQFGNEAMWYTRGGQQQFNVGRYMGGYQDIWTDYKPGMQSEYDAAIAADPTLLSKTEDSIISARLSPAIDGIAKAVEGLGGSIEGMQFGYGYAVDFGGQSGDMVSGAVADKSGNVVFQRQATGARGSEAEAALDTFSRMTLAAIKAAEGIDPIFQQIAAGIDLMKASAEQVTQKMVDVANMQTVFDYSKADPFTEYANSMAAAGDSLSAQMAVQRNHVLDLVKAYDGSSASIANLALATKERYQMELQLAKQVADSIKERTQSFDDAIRSVKLSVLDSAGKYDYYDKEAKGARDVLSTLTNAEAINTYSKRGEDAITSAYGLLSKEQQAATYEEFITRLEDFRDLTVSRLNAVPQSAAEDRKALVEEVKNGIKDILAATSIDAGTKIATIISGTHITVDIPSAGTSEVVAIGDEN